MSDVDSNQLWLRNLFAIIPKSDASSVSFMPPLLFPQHFYPSSSCFSDRKIFRILLYDRSVGAQFCTYRELIVSFDAHKSFLVFHLKSPFLPLRSLNFTWLKLSDSPSSPLPPPFFPSFLNSIISKILRAVYHIMKYRQPCKPPTYYIFFLFFTLAQRHICLYLFFWADSLGSS